VQWPWCVARDRHGTAIGTEADRRRGGRDRHADHNLEASVVPLPTQPTPADIIQKFKEKPINLEALFTGGNPFDETEPVTHNGDAEVNPDDVPF
jgi:hypothetical protein